MVRTEMGEERVVFERQEIDGRTHADWILTASLDEIDEHRCVAHVHLHYGGALWSAPLEMVLATFEQGAGDSLTDYLSRTA